MGQEYFINDEKLENKIRQLLPSQGGAGAGFDLSASTQIIPIVDLTESAEGSNVRQDLQTAYGYNNSTNHDISNASNTVIINNTGYYKIDGYCSIQTSTSGNKSASFALYDGTTYKGLTEIRGFQTTDVQTLVIPYSYTIFIGAGNSLVGTAGASVILNGVSRQIATIDGILVPLS